MKQMLKGETGTYVFGLSTKLHIQSTSCFQQIQSPLLALAYLSIPDTLWKHVVGVGKVTYGLYLLLE